MPYSSNLTDSEWFILEPLLHQILPLQKKTRPPNWTDGIFYQLILVPKLNINKKPRLDRDAVLKLQFILIPAVNRNQQPQNKGKQVDVSQVHRQSSG